MKTKNNRHRKTINQMIPLLSVDDFADRMAQRFAPFVKLNKKKNRFIWAD